MRCKGTLAARSRVHHAGMHVLALALLLVCAQRAAGARDSAAACVLQAPRRAHHSTPLLRLRGGGGAAADAGGVIDAAGILPVAMRLPGDAAVFCPESVLGKVSRFDGVLCT